MRCEIFYALQKSESTTHGSLFSVNLAELITTRFTITLDFTKTMAKPLATTLQSFGFIEALSVWIPAAQFCGIHRKQRRPQILH